MNEKKMMMMKEAGEEEKEAGWKQKNKNTTRQCGEKNCVEILQSEGLIFPQLAGKL